MDIHAEIEKLEKAIRDLEVQRQLVGDQAVDLAIASIREKIAALQSIAYGEQRKIVTILFADLVNYTTLFASFDSEDVRELMSQYFVTWKNCIESHGGIVEKFIGDAVMAVFGLRVTKEDDPEQAVLAALEMRSRLEGLNEKIHREQGIRLAMRVGINTGEVVISSFGHQEEKDFVVVGETVNIASRLQGTAPVGGILLTQGTYQMVRGIFDVRILDPIQVKGIEKALQVYLVLNSKRRAFRTAARGVEGVETRMIGREDELKRLQKTFSDTVQNGALQVITVMGEAGIGKSRLIYEFDNWLELLPESIDYFKGRAYQSTQNSPYSLMKTLFDFRFQIHDSDNPEMVWEKLKQGVKEALGNDASSSKQAYYIGRLLGFEIKGSSFEQNIEKDARLFHEQAAAFLREYYSSLARVNPVVILLEDIHWADNSSLELIQRLEVSLLQHPVLIACTARNGLYNRQINWGKDLAYHQRLDLQPLSNIEGQRLIDEILQRAGSIPHELRGFVLQKADGNPFYIEEGIKMLIDGGVIEKAQDGWRVNLEHMQAVKIPHTLTGLLQSRLDSLEPVERVMLQRAAVIGRVFWDQAVEYLEQEHSQKAMDERMGIQNILGKLRSREIIYLREPSSFQTTQEYYFKHSLFRDVTYDNLLKKQRRHYHTRAAMWFDEVTQRSGRTEEFASVIASHYEQAGNKANASSWYQRAGKHAAARYANEEAVHAFSKALDFIEENNTDRLYEILMAREQIFNRQGARARQAEDLQRLSQLNDLGRDDASRTELSLRLGNYYLLIGDYSSAIEVAKQGIEMGQKAGSIDKVAEGFYLWGRSVDMQQAHSESLSLYEKALELARSAGQTRLEADILLSVGPHFSDLNEYQEARKHLDAALNIYRSLGDRHGEGKALGNMGVTFWGQGNYAEAKRHFEAALKVIQEIGDRRAEGILIGNLGVIAYEQLDYAQSRRRHMQALNIARQVKDKLSECINLGNTAEAARDLGDFDLAQTHYHQALQLARELGNLQNQSAILASSSLLLEYLGNYVAAFDNAQQALILAQEAKSQIYEAYSINRLGQVLLQTGKHEEAAAHFQRAAEMLRELGLENRAVESIAGLAQVYRRIGEKRAAVRLAEDILEYLETNNLFGTDVPVRIYLTLYQVLSDDQDPRAPAVLEKGYRFLEELASKIDEENNQRSFLERVPVNRKLAELWYATR